MGFPNKRYFMTNFDKRRLSICAGVVAGMGALVSIASATHSWGGYHWARQTPEFTLQLGNNLSTADWITHLSRSSQAWNSPPVGTSRVVMTAITAGRSNKRCGMVNGT